MARQPVPLAAQEVDVNGLSVCLGNRAMRITGCCESREGVGQVALPLKRRLLVDRYSTGTRVAPPTSSHVLAPVEAASVLPASRISR
jgi:hypothetical protein